ncbi:MAG: ribosome silencing factor [Candidatus Marinimicrobia bacterium]|nr:ribosome silencing factor [Candidatus Neomarinimicrobiota bacterium]
MNHPPPALTAEQLAQQAAQACAEKKALEPLTLDVRGRSPVTDFLVLATGNSPPHLKALATEVERTLKDIGWPVYRRSGNPDSGWLVLDFIDVVVHLFLPEPRAFYDLEHLWKDGSADKTKPLL